MCVYVCIYIYIYIMFIIDPPPRRVIFDYNTATTINRIQLLAVVIECYNYYNIHIQLLCTHNTFRVA